MNKDRTKMTTYTLRISQGEREDWERAAALMGADTGHPISLASFVRIIMADKTDELPVIDTENL